MRKRCRRTAILPLPPRGLRPLLAADQLTDLALAHITNLDDVASGCASADVMWQMAGGVLTWSRVAQLTGCGLDEMQQQLDLMHAVVARFNRTGRVGFSGPEYQLAKTGVAVMDALAEMVDKPTAIAAASWAEERCNELRDGAHRCAGHAQAASAAAAATTNPPPPAATTTHQAQAATTAP